MSDQTNTIPAWKNPWFLFVFGLPAVVVVACFITLYLAVKSDDGLVTKDYYKEGLAINQDLSLEKKAKELNLNGSLMINDMTAILKLKANDQGNAEINGQPFYLVLQNMGVPARDQKITLVPIDSLGTWRGFLASPIEKGRWQVRVESTRWRLIKNIDGLLDKPIELK